MLQVEGAYQIEDYQQATRLHSFPKLMGVSFHAAWLTLFGFNILATILVSLFVEGSSTTKYVLLFIVIVMLVASSVYYLYLPYRVRKVFAQQKEIRLPFKMEISESGIRFENSMSQSMRTWDMFTKWKEDKSMLMLYISDAAFVMLPTRILTQEVIAFVREQLRKNKIREK